MLFRSGGEPGLAEMDALYRTSLLATPCDWNDPLFSATFRDIMGSILAADVPITPVIIDNLLNDSLSSTSHHTLQHFHCVLSYGSDQTIRIHPSFFEFLTALKRCGRLEWHINLPYYRRYLAIRCFEYIRTNLRDEREELESFTYEVGLNVINVQLLLIGDHRDIHSISCHHL